MNYSQALKCAILAQEVYGNFSGLRFSEFPSVTPELIDLESTGTQCAIFADAGTSIYIVFRGSENRIDWDTNFNLEQEVVEFQQDVLEEKVVGDREQVYPYEEESSSGTKMHRGFASAYMSVRERIHNYLKNHAASSLIITGHSLGGALATLCAVDVQYNFSNQVKNIDIYTFGAPRVGNNGFRASFNRRVPNSYRFVHGMDIVPALPRPWQGYRHVDTEYRLGSRFSLNFFSQRFKDHGIVNYIAALKKLIVQGS